MVVRGLELKCRNLEAQNADLLAKITVLEVEKYDLLATLKTVREKVKDDLFEATESFQGTNIIRDLEMLLDKIESEIAKAEGQK
jgi:predicted RNase H-like nuclease (RuvC/YqgF family)